MSLSRRAFVSTVFAAGVVSRRAFAEQFPIDAKQAMDVEYPLRMRVMDYQTAEPAGTIVIDPHKCFLYHVMGGGKATRYGVSVGKSTHAWVGEVTITRMAQWPVWVPAPYHLQQIPSLIKWKDGMPGGLDNPLGARAMYLYKGEVDTVNRIHGGAKTEWIGKKATAGCISLLNVDVVQLYSQVQVGTRVVMLG